MGLGSCHRDAAPTEPTATAAVELSGDSEPAKVEPQAAPLRVHLSFDDAPWMEEPRVETPPIERVRAINEALVGTLRERGVPASVFFNCDRLQPGDGSVELWSEAGVEVGNHTSSHANLAKMSLDEWMADVERCHGILSARLPKLPRYFRYPYLSQGDTQELRDGAKERLAALGYANAHVTVATTEWLLAFTYRAARARGDAELEADVVRAYRTHMVEAVRQGQALAREELSRDTPQVVLFHVNELAAEHLGDVLDDYEAEGWELVGLDEALDDPVFNRTDHYVGRGGLSWLARIHEDPETRPPYWFGDEEVRLMERFGAKWKPPAQ